MKINLSDQEPKEQPNQEEREDDPELRQAKAMERMERYFHKITKQMESAQILDYIQMMNKPWRLIWNNFLYGVARGFGIAIGFTLFAGTVLYFLRALGALNLPIVGNYIAEIVKIVQAELGARNF